MLAGRRLPGDSTARRRPRASWAEGEDPQGSRDGPVGHQFIGILVLGVGGVLLVPDRAAASQLFRLARDREARDRRATISVWYLV